MFWRGRSRRGGRISRSRENNRLERLLGYIEISVKRRENNLEKLVSRGRLDSRSKNESMSKFQRKSVGSSSIVKSTSSSNNL